jgi:hypothetical protein
VLADWLAQPAISKVANMAESATNVAEVARSFISISLPE